MSKYNELIVDALYKSELERLPNDTERAHWTAAMQVHGAALIAEHIAVSPEAVEVRRKRAQRESLVSPQVRAANLAIFDARVVELSREVSHDLTSIVLSPKALRSLPARQLDRLNGAGSLRVSKSPDSAFACIHAWAWDEEPILSGNVRAVVVMLEDASWVRTFVNSQYRVRPSDGIRQRLAKIPTPTGMNRYGLLDMHGPLRTEGTPFCPALLLISNLAQRQPDRELAARTLCSLNLHHFITGDTDRCLEVLDSWDQVMGMDLARKYKASADLVRPEFDGAFLNRERLA